MTATVMPEMLWENSDPGAELQRRFGFASTDEAASWAVQLAAEEYGLGLASLDRIVISAQNLMLWVTADVADTGDTSGPLMIKVCRLAAAHDWLTARAALVCWLADGGQPVARPVPARGGEHQILNDSWSIGVQPVLPGGLLDADDLAQVAAAGSTFGALHNRLTEWPDSPLLEHVQPVAGCNQLWVYPEGRADSVPTDLRDRLEQRIVDLPELPQQPVHADFRGANLLYQHGAISGVLDFEEARIDAAVVDLAHAVCLLGTWYRNWRPITPEAQTVFLDSYTEHRPLTEDEQAWLSPLVGWRMLNQGWWDEARRWLS